MYRHFIITTLVFVVIAFGGLAQPAMELRTEATVMQLAEPLRISLILRQAEGRYPQVADTLGDFVVLSRLSEPDSRSGPTREYQYLVTAYRIGECTIPAISAGEGLSSRPQVIRVVAPDTDSLQQYGDIKELTTRFDPPYRLMALLAAAILLLLLAAWWIWRRIRRVKPPAVGDHAPAPPAESDFSKLLRQWEAGELTPAELGENLSKAMARWSLHVPMATTQMVGEALRQRGSLSLADDVIRTLQAADGWRFGKQVPTLAEGRQAIQLIQGIISRPKDSAG